MRVAPGQAEDYQYDFMSYPRIGPLNAADSVVRAPDLNHRAQIAGLNIGSHHTRNVTVAIPGRGWYCTACGAADFYPKDFPPLVDRTFRVIIGIARRLTDRRNFALQPGDVFGR